MTDLNEVWSDELQYTKKILNEDIVNDEWWWCLFEKEYEMLNALPIAETIYTNKA